MSRDSGWRAAFLVIVALRIWLCLEPPTHTSDLYRNLGYGSRTWSAGTKVYETVASDFAPQFWTQFWGHQGYVYPPFTLTFFSVFGGLGLGLFWVKVLFTVCDLGTALFVARDFGELAGFLVFTAPITLWYTSHEGQFESLLVFLLIAAIYLARKGRWLLAGLSWALALQTKQFGFLLAPFFAVQLVDLPGRTGDRERVLALRRFLSGLALGALPFAAFYYHSMSLWLRPFENQTLRYNPYHWDIWGRTHAAWTPPWLTHWNALSSYLALAVALSYMVRRLENPLEAAKGAPLAAFLWLLKSLHWALFWYPITIPAFVMALPKLRRWAMILILLYALFDGNSVAHLLGRSEYAMRELPATVDRFVACRFTCDYGAR